MMRLFATTALVTLAALGSACRAPASPPQAPNNDVKPPTTTTGSGEVLGADRVPPGTKLEESPKLDSKDGIKPAATPSGD